MKVLVVEDDFIVRKGIILSLDWEKQGFTICGEAPNGIIGFEKVKELQPDIILTDIRMPGEDGLKLTERVREAYPWIRIVVLSGYDDFAYAQQAMKLGVFDYLLKPVNADELLKTVVSLRDKIEKEVFQQSFVENNYSYVKEHHLNLLLTADGEKKSNTLEQLARLNVSFSAPFFQVILVTVDDFFLLTQNSGKDREKLEQEICRLMETVLGLLPHEPAFRDQSSHFVAILNRTSSPKAPDRDTYSRFYQQMKDSLGFYITISLGEWKEGVDGIRSSYEEALQALRCRPYMHGEYLIQYRPDMQKGPKTFLNVQKKENELLQAMLQYNGDSILRIIQGIFDEAYEKQTEFQKLKTACLRIWMLMISNLEEMSINPENLSRNPQNFQKELESTESFSALKRCMLSFCRDISATLSSTEGAKYHVIIQKAMLYVKQHYMEEIHISQVVADLYVTPNHFSQVFKSQTGTNFSDYLNQYRIEQAKELLKNLDLKVYHVSEKVGYQNYKYFQSVFKKYAGCTPKEYRNSICWRKEE